MANPEHVAKLKKGIVAWNKWREANKEIIPDLEDADLKDAYLKKANLQGALLGYASLEGAVLVEANLHGARLGYVNLQGAKLRGANLGGAVLVEANLQGAVLVEANLQGALLALANLQGADLYEANLDGADLTSADLEGADLRGVNLQGADLRSANLKGTDVTGVKFNRKTQCRGIRLDSCYGSSKFERFAKDQAYLEELQESGSRGKLIYWTWFVFADCGRSFWPWACWSILFAVLFGIGFWKMGPDAFHISYLDDAKLGSYIYYSVVTFTTLGFGGIMPKTAAAAYWVMAEVITGYLMLGGLVSILANKLARRS